MTNTPTGQSHQQGNSPDEEQRRKQREKEQGAQTGARPASDGVEKREENESR